MKHLLTGIVIVSLSAVGVGRASASLLTAGACMDNDPACDGDPMLGIMLVNLPSGFSGVVEEIETPRSYSIIASSATLDAAAGIETFTGMYGAFIGPGTLRAGVTGILEVVPPAVALATTGTEMIGVSASASTFNNNSPITVGTAVAAMPLPLNIQGEDIHEGDYNGDGTLTAILQWAGLTVDVPANPGPPPVPRTPGEQFSLPGSAIFTAQVPEPSSLVLLGLSLGMLVFARRQIAARDGAEAVGSS